jgi:hypothetical protein
MVEGTSMNMDEMRAALDEAINVIAEYQEVIKVCYRYSVGGISAEVAMHEIKTTIEKVSH